MKYLSTGEFICRHNGAARFKAPAPLLPLHIRQPHDDSSRQTRWSSQSHMKQKLHSIAVQTQDTQFLISANHNYRISTRTTNVASHCQIAPQVQPQDIANFSASSNLVCGRITHFFPANHFNTRTPSTLCPLPLSAGPLILPYAELFQVRF